MDLGAVKCSILPALPREVDSGLVDDVHQDGGQVGHHEDTELLQNQMDFELDTSMKIDIHFLKAFNT